MMQKCTARISVPRRIVSKPLSRLLHQKYSRISVDKLLNEDANAQHVEVTGWIRTVRKQKKVAFAAIGDGTTTESLQVVMRPEDAINLASGTAVKVSGSWERSRGSKQSHELQATRVSIMGENDPDGNPVQPKYQSREFLRTIPHLRPRIPVNALLLRLRSQVIASLTRFFTEQGFVQTHTPIITSSDCEGAGEVFSVTSGRLDERKRDAAAPEAFFRSPKYLTVSAQLHLEALAQAVSKVWTLSPTFRAEKSDTPRHLSEFYMLEAEICFVESMHEVMDLVEDMLRSVVVDLRKSSLARELTEARRNDGLDDEADSTDASKDSLLERRWAGLESSNWPRITYADAVATLQRASESGTTFSFAPDHDDGLQAEHEKFLANTIGRGKPVFITDYPRAQKPFYMAPSETTPAGGTGKRLSTSTVACFDLLVPDLCELAGGSMREARLDRLDDAMVEKGLTANSLDWYRDLRRFGSAPHGGFGLGFDRLLCYLSGIENVRDVVAFPRWYGRCDC